MRLIEKTDRGRQPLPLRLIAYGTEGIGKSTFASQAQSPVFLQIEGGLAVIGCDKSPLSKDGRAKGSKSSPHK